MAGNFWLIELYSDDTANVSVTSKAEIEARKDDLKEWQWESTDEAGEEDMIERAEEQGFEHDPW